MNNQKIINIIKHYKSWKQENPDTWIKHCNNQKKLVDTIAYAALAENHLGKKNYHQRRLKKINLEKFSINLIEKEIFIQKAKSFDELLKIIEECKIKGIGELACYDTAYRIGTKIGLHPKFIYLHAGTKKGAENILGKRLNQKFINRTELPNPFHNKNLSNAEIEDILCIYKDRFKKFDFIK